MPGWWSFDRDRNSLCIHVYVQPNARSTELAGLHGEALKIRVAEPPMDRRANLLLIDFLAKKLGLPSSRIGIKQGHRSRRKVVEIVAPEEATLRMIRDWEHT